jgi:hypothetical protein
MYTREERETFGVCISLCMVDKPGRDLLSALLEAMGASTDPRGVTANHVIHTLGGGLSRSVLAGVPRMLGELARDARGSGVPIEVTEDSEQTLWYSLSLEQADLIRAQLGPQLRSVPFSF